MDDMATRLQPAVPVIDEGRGPPVVFLHGAPHYREEWREVIPLLEGSYRCLAPDLPGFGNSPRPPAAYDFSIDTQVAFFDAWVADILGDEPFALVTHDIGAIMGMAWAALHPERVRGLIVMNTVLHADYSWHTLARIWSAPVLGQLLMASLNRPAYRAALGRNFPQLRPHQIDRMYDGLTPVARQSTLRQFRAMTRPDFFAGWEERLASVPGRVATTVLWGGLDPLIPASYAARIGGAVKLLDDCSHWVPLEQPARVAAEVRRLD